ncbi:DUF2304 domain-containing protein [Halorientalis marina]|uniref:DUF2304 domain-containing protein n=1 Tax=Halorientalis marina TaxID=2931976 RepID=UPI001FF1B473|nr:DUF2304 domain-containing protein [Halorientalis marina]
MEYSLVNALSVLVGVVFLWNGYAIVARGREDLVLLGMSLIVGAGMIFVGIFPNVFEVIAGLLGLELKARAILVVSNLVLFVVVTYLFNRIGQLADRVSRLNEDVSLLRAELDERDE